MRLLARIGFGLLSGLAALAVLLALTMVPHVVEDFAAEPEDAIILLICAGFALSLCVLWAWCAWTIGHPARGSGAGSVFRRLTLGAAGAALLAFSSIAGVDARLFALCGLLIAGTAWADWFVNRLPEATAAAGSGLK